MNFYQSKQWFFGVWPDIHGASTIGLNENDFESDLDVNNDVTSHGKIDKEPEVQVFIAENIILLK